METDLFVEDVEHNEWKLIFRGILGAGKLPQWNEVIDRLDLLTIRNMIFRYAPVFFFFFQEAVLHQTSCNFFFYQVE